MKTKGNIRKIKEKSLGKLKKEVQEVCNRYIRLRDKGKPCICCDKFNKLQAGHFWAVGTYDGLRYDETNIHGECARCNAFDQNHLENYRINLKKRIGEEELKRLDMKAANYKANGRKWTRYELANILLYYKNKIKELENEL